MGEGGFDGGMQPPSGMGVNGNPPAMNKNGGKEPPKPVTMADLKKLKNKKVEIQGIQEKDGTQGKRIIVVGEHKAGIFRFVSKVSACCRLSDSSF